MLLATAATIMTDSSESSDEDGYFGQQQVPLTDEIKEILEEYPDGQIFKEIIQNADDAKATEVKFFIDERSHGQQNLLHPSLAKFQGPSLLAYNNAVFTDEDWTNIQKLKRSDKRSDPFRIGKFGIGFNSVFHVTDLPTIISGDQICFMDPQKKIWKGDPGHKYKLTKNNPKHNDSFTPFQFHDACSLGSNFTYPGTMIRLPLRNKSSSLSNTLYDIEKLKLLINALKDDADILLLFLRYIEKIEVFVISDRGKPSKSFSVKLDKTENIRALKKKFFAEVKKYYTNPKNFLPLPQLQYEVTIVIQDFKLKSEKDCHWVIVHRVGYEKQEVLKDIKKISSLPWIGVALPLSSQCFSRLFCFLPMPDSKEINPPLPVCVHGTFGLTKDRRHLKWPTFDMRNDDGALWNDLLLSKMFPSCYAHCLGVLKSKCNLKEFYLLWPNVILVQKTNWEISLKPLLSLLLQDQLFWSQNGSWVKLQSSVYVVPQMNSGQFPQVVINALIKCGKVVVILVDRVWEAVQFIHASAYPFTLITPSLVRQALKSNPNSCTNISRTERFDLLKYCIEDEDYSDLCDLVLLPLANNTFTAFKDRHHYPINICDKAFLETKLLANNEAALVNIEKEDSNLHNKLLEIAGSNCTQLQHLTTKAVAMMLKQLLPFKKGWCCYGAAGGFYNENWLKTFWKWVATHKLSYFVGIPLLPICNGNNSKGFSIVALQNISKSQVIMYDKLAYFTSKVIGAAEKLGCSLTCSQDFEFFHNINLNDYVHDFTPSSVLSISSQVINQNFTFTQEEAKALTCFLFQYPPASLSTQQKFVLLNLRIFPSIQNNKLYSLQNATSMVAGKSGAMIVLEPECLDKYKFCIPSSPLLLTSCDKSSIENLKIMLSQYVWFPTKLEIILHVILQNKEKLMKENIVKLFAIILKSKEYHNLLIESQSKLLVNTLRSIKFVPTCKAYTVLASPYEVYDPKDLIVKELFEGQNVFPVVPFVEEHFSVLRELGMKNSNNLEISDIIKVAQLICDQKDTKAKTTRAHKLLEFLSSSKGDLLLCSHFSLGETLATMPWLPVMAIPPKGYPKCLGWKGATGSYFLSPKYIYASSSTQHHHKKLPYLIGSQMKLLQFEGTLLPKLLASLQITESVPVDALIQQTLNLIRCQHKLNSFQLKDYMKLLYEHLQLALNNDCDNHDQCWHYLRQSEVVQVSESKFVKPSLVACSFDDKSMTVGRLEPYLYVLPGNLQQYSRLFCFIGAIEQVTLDDVLAVLENIASNQNKNDQKLTINILKWICNNFTACELENLHNRILVPVDGDDIGNKLLLKPANQVAYLDEDLQWLKKDKVALSNIMESYFLVHSIITTDMACTLRLKPLNKMIVHNEELCFEQAGQSEPLTIRLNRILEEYKETSVIQELLQNADDAEAKEVAIYYDTRNHDKSNLFFPGMAESYGPALLFYNSTEFSQEDFKNITKISGKTKANKPLKIGKFGVGFCSVYHITDVPSFLSGETFFILDPTLQCLHSEIKSKFNPGIKINYIKHRFLKTSNQFIPYAGVHGFDPMKPFKGTLFRFPLRCRSSQISKNICTEDKLLSIIDEIKQSAPKLLMFLNNVKKISFYQSYANNFKKVFAITASKAHITTIIDSSLTEYKVFSPQFSGCKEEKWIISTNSQQFRQPNGCMQDGIASVSVRLKSNVKTQSDCIDLVKGECFCYLPLHIETGLPVHVSSNFAVMINRRGLWKADNSGYATGESDWNKKLMGTVVFQAYIALLLYLKQLHQNGKLKDYSYYCLWPVQLREMVPWEVLLNRFYDSILSSSYPLFYSRIGSWKHLKESKFLSSDILLAGFQKDLQLALEKVTNILKLPVVDLPDDIWNRFVDDDRFNEQTINEEQFLHLFYNSNTLSKVSNKHKNIVIIASLITYANNEHTEILPDLMKATKCIPCCPNGIKYKKPQEIVDPKSRVSNLFTSDECMCPDNEFFLQSDLLRQSLVNLGMMQSLPWDLVIDRAKKMQYILKEKSHKGCDYLNTLIECIKENVNQGIAHSVKNELQKVAFLPVMQKPPDYMLDWKGDSNSHLLCGPKLTKLSEGNNTINAIYACGSQVAILDTDKIPSKLLTNEILNVLGVTKQIKELAVINHFNVLLKWFHQFSVNELNKSIIQFTTNVVTEVYRYWGRLFESEQLSLESLSCFRDKACVWNGMAFLHPSVISFNWPTDGPFIYKLPDMLPYSIRPIMKYLGVEDDFPIEILVNALCKMKQQYRESCITPECQAVVSLILPKIADNVPEDVEIFLPDSNYILKNANELKYNDAPWCTLQKKYTFCHSSIGRDIALGLKVEPVRNAVLKKFEFQSNPILNTFSVNFGQEEKLTERLKNILNDYPKDCTFIKEIIQNADDSGAKQLYVILDKRNHTHDNDSEKVISEEWKTLQGPALMFWNDSIFTDNDFAGIQKLGLGSKRDDADKIGRYGIGFNVVYHFTDCPSFVTDNKLCIMDPLYHFIALEGQKPGMMFNDFNELCKIFPGMKSPYLLNDRGEVPNEIKKKGSLFRLPLRLTEEMARVSTFCSDIVSLNQLEMELDEWVSQVSETLLFMQHVEDVKYYVINDRNWSNSLHIHLKSSKGHKTVKECGKSKLIWYPLTLYKGSTKSQWFVQLGEGNIEDPDFDWDQAKPQNTAIQPQHGIAVPVHYKGSFEGKSFCFLPLPDETHLPVHIHGYFVLRSDRRGLWVSSNMKGDDKRNNYGGANASRTAAVYSDSKAKWNELLLRSIGVSYAHFLISYKSEISVCEKSLHKFYKLFPKFKACNDKHWLLLAESLYITLIDLNAPILAKLVYCDYYNYSRSTVDKKVSAIEWYALCKPDSPDECFFRTVSINDELCNVLATVGMNIIDTPMKIYEQFKKVNNDLQLLVTSKESILKYYSNFCYLIYNDNLLPCPLSRTKFENIKCFATFITHLMQSNGKFLDEDSDSDDSDSENTDVKDLLTLGLIVTADEYLHCLSDGVEIVSSAYWHLFPNSQHCFIHKDLQDIYPHDSDYLLYKYSNRDIKLQCILSIIADNIPLSWKETTEALYSQKNVEMIRLLLECLVNDPVFCEHSDDIMTEFALLPADNDRVYSKASEVLPLENVLVPDTKCQYNIDNVKELMNKLEVPLLRHDLVGSLMDKINIRMPNISNPETILRTLYLIKNSNAHMYKELNERELILLFTILQLISYSSIFNQDYIKELPIFTNINGELTCLASASEVWIWDVKKICTAGVNKWIKQISDSVIFLNSSSPWACLQHEAEHLGMKSINTSKCDVYCKFIIPNFHLLDLSAQMDHLKFIKKEIYPACMLATSRHTFSIDDKINLFIDEFKALRCIPDSIGKLQTIDFFYNHEEMVFKVFCNEHYFLPIELRTKEWLEFLKYFGLKVAPTRQQFVSYCKQVIMFDDISSIKTASLTLLNALFYEPPLDVDNKYKDIHTDQCLQEVSQIPIAIVEDTPDLNFIATQKLGAHAVRHHDVTITKLAGSSLKENKYLVWTIAPLIELNCYNENSQVHQNKLKYLEVLVSPSIDDVALNLKNLSATMFANSMRTKRHNTDYVILQSKQLPKVVIAMLEHMQQKMLSDKCALLESECHELSQSEIIPVKISVNDVEEFILVKPVQVLHMDTSDVAPFYPFLYPLIKEADSVLTLLLKIGVEMSLNFSHIKYILESTKDKFKENEVDSSNKKIIIKATQDLITLLKQSKAKYDIVLQLHPLYLLSEENILMECHKLVVYDITHINRFSLPSGYAYLHPVEASHELLQYLPEEFGLRSLKSILSYEIVNDNPTENLYPRVSILGEIIKSKEFKDSLVLFSSYCTQNTMSSCVADIIENFQNNLIIKYYNNLHAIPQVTLGNKLINLSSTINYSFFLEKSNDQHWTLSLKNTNDSYSLPSFMTLAKQLCSSLRLKSTGYFDVADDNGLPDLSTFVCSILQCVSVSDISSVIKAYVPEVKANFDTTDIEVTSGISMNSTFSDSLLERYDQQLLDLLLPSGAGDNNEQKRNTYGVILQNITEELNELAKRNPEPQVDINEAKVWIRQAKHDYSALSALMHVSKTDNAHFATVCFMAHQVAEKSLKAGTYAKCGLDPMNLCTHQLTSLAMKLNQLGCSMNSQDVTLLNSFYLPTRYPNRWCPSAVPEEHYSSNTAQKAFHAATRIFEEMQKIIDDTN